MSEFHTKPNPDQPDRCPSIDPHDELQCTRRIHEDDQCHCGGIGWKKGTPRYIKVTQTILASPELNEQGVYGNCLQAAFASLLGKPLDAVPHFGAFSTWPDALRLWLAGDDLEYVSVAPEDLTAEPCVLVGPSPRGFTHAVVGNGNEVIWDPHPSRDGLTKVTGGLVVRPRTFDEPTLAALATVRDQADDGLAERVEALADLCAEAITQVASSPHSHWREGGAGGTCRTCEAATERARELRERLTALTQPSATVRGEGDE